MAAEKRYDLIVIGTGSAASGVASRCREAGWSVAVVGETPFGGTCALEGGMDDYASVRREGHDGAGTAYKVLIDGETGCLIGAHLFGPDAQEVINLFALSIRLGLKAGELGKLLSAYPSSSSNVESMLM